MPIDDYAAHDGVGLAELVRKGEVTAGELAEEALSRIEKHNPTLNAVVTDMADQGRQIAGDIDEGDAAAPFAGVPFLLKDIMGDFEGVATQYGSRFVAGSPAPMHSTLTTRFLAAGLVPLGKTNVPEFGLLPVSESALYGPARNPWNPDHTPGGSSGGSAAAVAAGIVPLAHANDGGGSIRIPASSCGLVGLKPSRARIPQGPMIGDAMSGLTTDLVVSRTVRDTAVALDIAAGPEPGDPYFAPHHDGIWSEDVGTRPGNLRIGFTTKTPGGTPVHEECAKAVTNTAKLLESLGHHVEEASPPLDNDMMQEAFMAIWATGVTQQIEVQNVLFGKTPNQGDLEPLTIGLWEAGKQISGADYLNAVAMLQIMSRSVAQWHDEYDLWLTPTLGEPPLRIGTVDINEGDPQKAFEPILDYVPFTPIENATGQPAISLPLHWTPDGLPVGVHFAGRAGDEATLIRIAAQLEQAQPWIDRHPPIWN
ncbi:amidase [Pyruvatibacter sp. HU-CL02332]|uniref:amidase n=1 Tax=Pyruvatibacter sp. HU-CL02332 TaxID=3127650 RepID=UPI00296A87AE|nr:amidase family protein [Alphaproteobacteria bacterium]